MIILRQKLYAWRHHTGIVVGKDEIRKLRSLNYPKLYVGFLEKINPLVQELSNLTGEDELVHAAIIYELDEGGEPYTENKDGKEYKCLFYDDLNQAADFGYSEIAGILWCDDKGDWYRKKGLLIKKFEKVDNPKTILKACFDPDLFEQENQRKLAEKICKEIERL